MEKRLFGTDGIRGTYGKWPLTGGMVSAIGFSAARRLALSRKKKKISGVLIGNDTRASGAVIERLLAREFFRAGVPVKSAGVIPTPGLAFLTRHYAADLGIMISASHNLAADNGIKFFRGDGFKLSDDEERAIEKEIFARANRGKRKTFSSRPRKPEKVCVQPYLDYLLGCVPGLRMDGIRVVVDCANGAVSGYARRLFGALGADLHVLHENPDGFNINRGCGSLHPRHAAAMTRKKKAQVGFSFDGDGDRVIVSDENGRIVDGDYIMAFTARHLRARGRLAQNTVVATSMSNFGLEKYLSRLGIRMLRADVGDRFVLELMLRHKANLGGEQSGHIIFLDHSTTGDGLLSALQILRIMRVEKKTVSGLAAGFRKYPQLLVNVKVREKKKFGEMPAVQKIIERSERELNGNGRLVVRYSGTEPLARVMVEGERKTDVARICRAVSRAIEREIGACP